MHKMPRIWLKYLQTLMEQRLFTQTLVPIQTLLRDYRRYLKFDPTPIEEFIEFLVNSEQWQEAAERLAEVLNDDDFYSIKGKMKHQLWLELCDLITNHANEVSGLKVDTINRGGIRKFTNEVIGRLWTSTCRLLICMGLFDKARDIFEEGMTNVVTVRDFSVVFDAYSQFEASTLAAQMETDVGDVAEEEENGRLDCNMSFSEKKFLHGFWLNDDNVVDLRLVHLEHLMDRTPELANSILLRQNPHM